MIELNDKYAPLWESNADIFIVTGGRGSGKSFAVGDFIENLTFEAGHTVLFSRYTLTSAHLSVIPEFCEKIEAEGHQDYFNINKTEIQNNQSGSNILFRGLKTSSGNQTANLKGTNNLTTWVLDEAEELQDEETFDKIDESIRKAKVKNRVILVLNPTTKEHWIYKRFFEDVGVDGDFNGQKGNVCYIHTSYLDNLKNLSSKFITKADKLKATNPAKYAHRFMAAWLDAVEGTVFNNWRYGEFDTSLSFGYGLDFGFFPDPDVCVKVAIDEKRKRIYVQQVLKMNNAGTQGLKDKLIQNTITGKVIIADSAEKRLISDLSAGNQLRVRRVIKGAGSILDGIKTMQDYEIILHPDSASIAVEFNNYAWADKKSGVPVDAYNHWIDAIRYYVSTFTRKSNKSKLTPAKRS